MTLGTGKNGMFVDATWLQIYREQKDKFCMCREYKKEDRTISKTADHPAVCSLYAVEPVLDICKKNRWNYIIRYKEGSIPGIMKEYEAIREKGHEEKGNSEFINAIGYKKHEVNVLQYQEEQVWKKEVMTIKIQWLTDMEITKKNAYEIACAGRKRWKIENERFNTQKNIKYDLEHSNSHNWNAIKIII